MTRTALPVPDGALRIGDLILNVYRDHGLRAQPGQADFRVWQGRGGLLVMASSDTAQHGTLLHVSISYPKRLPPWSLVVAVRNVFYPRDVDAAMILPRASDYVNVHQFTLHLWELPVEWGLR